MKKALALTLISTFLFSAMAGTIFINLAIGDVPYPEVSTLSPENGKTYYKSDVTLTFNVNITVYVIYFPLLEEHFKAECQLDGKTVYPKVLSDSGTYSVILKEVSDGIHRLTVIVHAIYTTADGERHIYDGSSEEIYFSVEASPPQISIITLDGKTYEATDAPLNFTVSEPTSWIGYSLDGQANVAITGNTTLSGLSDGFHSLVVYATDTAGRTGTSRKVSFKVMTQGTQPQETEPEAQPSEPFPTTLILIAATTIAIAGVAFTIYHFTKSKKPARKTEE